MEVSAESHKPVHLAILPGTGVGHLNPLLELSKRLIQLHPHSFFITFIVIPTSSSDEDSTKLSQIKTSFLSTLPSGDEVDFRSLPPPRFEKGDFSTLPEEMVARVYLSIKRSLPSLRDLLVDLSTSKRGPVSSLIVDMFGTQAFDVAIELGIKPYVCFQSSAMGLSLFLHLPEMDRTVTGNFVDMDEPVNLPGCVPVPGKDLPTGVLVRKAPVYSWVLEHAKMYGLAKGIILNSFDALEPGAIRALRVPVDGKSQVYPIGPLTKTVGPVRQDDKYAADCLKWLDEQPPDSVLFVNFGSGGTLSKNQLNEIASGLELSGERFLWVVRIPNEESSFGPYPGINEKHDPLSFLPEGFLERTIQRGLVMPNWAPQVQILAHGSTGGFLTHCGWNSILESTVGGGIPFIAWPLFAEQNLNAVFLEKDLKAAFRVRKNEPGGLVKREQIVRLVKALMAGEEGKEMRRRMRAMKEEAAKTVREGGSSSAALGDLAAELLKSVRLTSGQEGLE